MSQRPGAVPQWVDAPAARCSARLDCHRVEHSGAWAPDRLAKRPHPDEEGANLSRRPIRRMKKLGHSVSFAWLAVAALGAASLAALAAQPIESVRPAQPNCPNEATALGVSRTIEIDTKGGPGYGDQQYRMNTLLGDREVVLTFDDGPLPVYTKAILKALDQHCTKATFFSVGRMAIAYPDTVKEIIRRGHTLGAHTWSHRYQLGRVTQELGHNEIELGFSAVQKAAGQPIAPFFRFPFLSDSRSMLRYLANRDVAVFSIDVDAVDYRARTPERVVANVMADLEHRRKGILLLHDIQPATAAALPEVLRQLKARGYRIVHLQPKASLPTLAAYDAEVDKEVVRLQTRIAERPLAPRTLTWAMADQKLKSERLVRKVPPRPATQTPLATAVATSKLRPRTEPFSGHGPGPRKPLAKPALSVSSTIGWETTVAQGKH